MTPAWTHAHIHDQLVNWCPLLRPVRYRDDPKVVLEGSLEFVPTHAAFSPDGHLMSFAGGHAVALYSMEQQRVLYTVPDAHTGRITGLAWAPGVSWFATSSEDHTIRLWKADS